MSERIKILILVKTYPVLSKKYIETVCTAGIKEDGSWIRIYPIPFRLMEDDVRFAKFQWIEASVEKRDSNKDFRPESYFITDVNNITPHEKIGTENDWKQRRLLLTKTTVYRNINDIINLSKSPTNMSLAIFKPKEIKDLIIVPISTEDFETKKQSIMELHTKQKDLFEKEKEVIALAEKVPYIFQYKFTDDNDTIHTLTIEDWEIGMLYRNCLKKTQDANVAVNQVKKKYLDEFKKTDIHLFLGTTKEHHQKRAKNPFIIIGVFHPPKIFQNDLNFD